MPQQVGEHSGPCPEIDLARRVRVAQHVAAEVGRVHPGLLRMLDENVADRGRGGETTNGLLMHTNT